MNKFQKRVNKVKEYLKDMSRFVNYRVSERELKMDATWVVRSILKDEPNWLNEKW